MDVQQLKVSIITIVFNGDAHLESTIQSVLGQTYGNLEYIIVDGGSTDNSLTIIKKYAESSGIKYVSEKDNGISDAFNKGIRMASGDLVALLNADDYYEPSAVAHVVENYAGPDTVICGNILLRNSEKSVNLKVSTLQGVHRKMTIWHPGMFVPKQVYDKVGLYEEKIRVLMDYEFVLRCLSKKVSFRFIDHIIANMRYGGVSNRLIRKSMNEALAIKEKYYPERETKNKLEFYYYLIYFKAIIFAKGLLFK